MHFLNYHLIAVSDVSAEKTAGVSDVSLEWSHPVAV